MSVVGTSVLLGTIACTARGTRSVVGATSGLLSTVACTASGSGSVVGVAMSGGGGVVCRLNQYHVSQSMNNRVNHDAK